ncbi:2,3-diaminopropionate biosynthesis protein SbnB [Nakamurella sp.]|uniref:2,3-diaminopropionate biosynthesis protein SbnB n=1 Tax=Nakamurella sp. TaxID=1869182 RepID=UPI003B3A3CB3
MLILRSGDVAAALAGRELEIVEVVDRTYRAHAAGRTAVPHSVFLRFPDRPRERIIALPAFVGGSRPGAGVKWISSFPGNVAAGAARASAVLVLNSLVDGRPEALLEASLLSAARTAAGAALAARTLAAGRSYRGIGLIGTGVINFEVLRYVTAVLPDLATATVFDTDPRRAADFADRAGRLGPRVEVAADLDDVLARHPLVSLATTAAEPHTDLRACRPGTVVLHVSLRDIEVPTILRARNVVDDADHVCRERTSLHLAELATGDRSFIAAGLGDLLTGAVPVPEPDDRLVIFSPFGLGALDIALAEFVRATAQATGAGVDIPDFLPSQPVSAATH